MIVGLHIDNCGCCGHAVIYRKEPTVPTGWVFHCGNVLCGFHGIEHVMPTVNAVRFYKAPVEKVA